MDKITCKRDMYALLSAGNLGNTSPMWTDKGKFAADSSKPDCVEDCASPLLYCKGAK